MPELFDATNLGTLKWPESHDGQYAKKYLSPLVEQGISPFIKNVSASMQVLKIDDIVLPVIIATDNYSDTWVCSVSTLYVSYPLETLHLVENPILQFLAKQVVGGIGKIGRRGNLNSVIYVNDWLFSVDLYPQGLTQEKVRRIIQFLKTRFPRHALVFRSLTEKTNAELMVDLKKEGCRLLASRSVFFTDSNNPELYTTRIIKSDMKLWKEKTHQVVDGLQLTDLETERVLELYRKLYIDNHSNLNPKVTLEFVKHLIGNRLFQIRALKVDGVIEGVVGFFIKDDVMMCPLFGYDKSLDNSNQIYRLLSTCLLLEAKENKCLFHQSAGGSFFKKIRRAVSYTESMAIYTEHLPLQQKFPWFTLRTFINNFAIPYMQKY